MSHPPGGAHAGAAPCSWSNSALAATRSNARDRSELTRGPTSCVRTAVATWYAVQRERSAMWLLSTSARAPIALA